VIPERTGHQCKVFCKHPPNRSRRNTTQEQATSSELAAPRGGTDHSGSSFTGGTRRLSEPKAPKCRQSICRKPHSPVETNGARDRQRKIRPLLKTGTKSQPGALPSQNWHRHHASCDRRRRNVAPLSKPPPTPPSFDKRDTCCLEGWAFLSSIMIPRKREQLKCLQENMVAIFLTENDP
jgi:hypothetical protein